VILVGEAVADIVGEDSVGGEIGCEVGCQRAIE
jgi:hypothetical protein